MTTAHRWLQPTNRPDPFRRRRLSSAPFQSLWRWRALARPTWGADYAGAFPILDDAQTAKLSTYGVEETVQPGLPSAAWMNRLIYERLGSPVS